jgi:hypothetical protein
LAALPYGAGEPGLSSGSRLSWEPREPTLEQRYIDVLMEQLEELSMVNSEYFYSHNLAPQFLEHYID